MSAMTVLTEETLQSVAGGLKIDCARPPGRNHAELYAWSTHCAREHGGDAEMWYMDGVDYWTRLDGGSRPAKPPKKGPKK